MKIHIILMSLLVTVCVMYAAEDPTEMEIAESTLAPAPRDYSSLESLPDDAILNIAQTLSDQDLAKLARTSRRLRQIVQPELDRRSKALIEYWTTRPITPVTLSGYTGPVNSVVFSPDGKLFASGSEDKIVRLWNTITGEARQLVGHTGAVKLVVFSPDGTSLASISDADSVRLWNIQVDESKQSFMQYYWQKLRGIKVGESKQLIGPYGVRAAAFSPDGTLLAAGYLQNIIMWDLYWNTTIRQWLGHPKIVTFSPDGTTILAAGSHYVDGYVIQVLNIKTGKGERIILQLHTVERIAYYSELFLFSPDLKLLAMRFKTEPSGSNIVNLFNTATGEVIKQFTGFGGTERLNILSLAFSPDGKLLAMGLNDGTIRLFEIETGTEVKRLIMPSGTTLALAFSPKGRTLVSGDSNGTIILWRAGKQ